MVQSACRVRTAQNLQRKIRVRKLPPSLPSSWGGGGTFRNKEAMMRRWGQIIGWAVSVALAVALVSAAVWLAYTQ